jgi:hypothetical protein
MEKKMPGVEWRDQKLYTPQSFQGNWRQATLVTAVDVHHISVVMRRGRGVTTGAVEAGISVVLITVQGARGSATRWNDTRRRRDRFHGIEPKLALLLSSKLLNSNLSWFDSRCTIRFGF